jgi:hypothetical protein
MKAIRKLALIFLLVYFGFGVGVFFHSHSPGSQHATNCQLCKISHISQDTVNPTNPAPESHNFGLLASEDTFPCSGEFAIRLGGRAPPLS